MFQRLYEWGLVSQASVLAIETTDHEMLLFLSFVIEPDRINNYCLSPFVISGYKFNPTFDGIGLYIVHKPE